jgi:hypothetical protein
MDLTGILQSAPQILRDTPFLINLFQLLLYAGLILTFGGFVMKAYRGYLSAPARVLMRVVFGFLALVTGLGITWLIPDFSDVMVYNVIQALFLNVIIGGAVATVVLFLALRMVSYHIYNIKGLEKEIDELEKLEEKARNVERKEKQKRWEGIHHPVRVGGLALLASFLVVGLIGFGGFPSPMEEMGITQKDLDMMADQIESMSDYLGGVEIGPEWIDECMGATSLMSMDSISRAQSYSNPEVRRMIEDHTGESVSEMYSVTSDMKMFVMSITDTKFCVSTTTTICACNSLSED